MRSLNNLSAVLKFLTQNTPAYLPRFVYLRSYANITDGVSGLNDALANVGPISVSIDATPDSFYFYQGGLYYNADCKSGMDDLDHTVLAVGYTTVDGAKYSIVKNSCVCRARASGARARAEGAEASVRVLTPPHLATRPQVVGSLG